jgi:hypothetical protein
MKLPDMKNRMLILTPLPSTGPLVLKTVFEVQELGSIGECDERNLLKISGSLQRLIFKQNFVCQIAGF